MKTLIFALLLIPGIAQADRVDDLIRAYANSARAAKVDPGDPAFDTSGANTWPQAQSPSVNNQALTNYLNSKSALDRAQFLSEPGQSVISKGLMLGLQDSLARSERQYEQRQNSTNYLRYFGTGR